MLSNEIIYTQCEVSLNTVQVLPQIITTKQYFENPCCIEKCKITDLRDMLRHYKKQINFKLSPNYYSNDVSKMIKELYNFKLIGNKPKLLERLIQYFHLERGALLLQRIIRGYFVRLIIKLRGPALKKRSLCINETDFYSLEPLDNIPHNKFFSYMDNNNFIYGFELNSLMAGIKHRSHKMLNPYTRDSMNTVIPVIKKIYRIQQLIIRQQEIRKYTKNNNSTSFISDNNSNNNNNIRLPAIRAIDFPLSYNVADMITNIRNIRSKSILERIQTIFMEIDQLGHYTNSNWFIQLEHRDCLRFFRYLHDIWHHRAGLSIDVKMKICPLWDPFVVMNSNPFDHTRFELEEIRMLCVSVIEDMIYTGVDTEYRMLGAFHVLSALTIVSMNARNSMMWLYESLA